MRLKAGAAMRLKADAAEILLTFQPAHHFVIALGSQTQPSTDRVDPDPSVPSRLA